MAESTLSIAFADLKSEVGYFLGYGRTVASFTAAQSALVIALVQSGVRRVYYPTAAGPDSGYEWSWLRPTTTLSITANDGDYDLPDSFARILGNFHYAADVMQPEIKQISAEQILELRSSSDQNDDPWFFAVRPKAFPSTAVGQRWEVIFYPEPNAARTLYYSYEAYSGVLSDTVTYPLGGMQLAELYIESCLAVAEQKVKDAAGLHSQAYQALLADAIARDRKRGAKWFGSMGHKETEYEEFHHGDTATPYPVTYKTIVY